MKPGQCQQGKPDDCPSTSTLPKVLTMSWRDAVCNLVNRDSSSTAAERGRVSHQCQHRCRSHHPVDVSCGSMNDEPHDVIADQLQADNGQQRQVDQRTDHFCSAKIKRVSLRAI